MRPIAEEFKDVLGKLEISHDDYIRTTEQRHKEVVGELLQNLFDAGDIYQDEYEDFIPPGSKGKKTRMVNGRKFSVKSPESERIIFKLSTIKIG